MHCSLSTNEPHSPEEEETALFKRWVRLAIEPAAEQKEKETKKNVSRPSSGVRSCVVPTTSCKRAHLWGAAFLREAQLAGFGVTSTWERAAEENAVGRLSTEWWQKEGHVGATCAWWALY